MFSCMHALTCENGCMSCSLSYIFVTFWNICVVPFVLIHPYLGSWKIQRVSIPLFQSHSKFQRRPPAIVKSSHTAQLTMERLQAFIVGILLLYDYIHFIKTDHWRPPAPGTLSSVPRPPHSIDTEHRAVYTPHTVLPLMTEGQPCHRVANGNLPLSWEPEQCKISGGNNADRVSPLGSIRVMRFCTHRIQSPNFTLRVNHKSMYTHIEWQRVNCVAKVAIEVLWVKTFFSGFSPDWAIGLQRIWPSIVYSLLIHRDL